MCACISLWRLVDETFTVDEVKEMLDGLQVVVRGEVEMELINTAHTNVLLLRQLFSQAEKFYLRLQSDISELENRWAVRRSHNCRVNRLQTPGKRYIMWHNKWCNGQVCSHTSTKCSHSDIAHVIVHNRLSLSMRSWGVAAGANPSLVSGRGQGTPWISCQLITGPSLMSWDLNQRPSDH